MMMMLKLFPLFSSFSSLGSLKKKTKRLLGARVRPELAAAPNVAKLSSPLDEACLNIYVSVKKRERKNERGLV